MDRGHSPGTEPVHSWEWELLSVGGPEGEGDNEVNGVRELHSNNSPLLIGTCLIKSCLHQEPVGEHSSPDSPLTEVE